MTDAEISSLRYLTVEEIAGYANGAMMIVIQLVKIPRCTLRVH